MSLFQALEQPGFQKPAALEAAEFSADLSAQQADTAPKEPEGQTLQGACLVCWGPAGAGTSTLALNLATELALAGARVLLIDAAVRRPALTGMLALIKHAPGLTAVLRLISQNRLTLQEFTRLCEPIEFAGGSFSLMAGISNPSRWQELQPHLLEKLVKFASQTFDVLVVDVDSELEQGLIAQAAVAERNAAALTFIELADEIIAVCPGDPIGLNRFLWSAQELPAHGFRTVVNRARSSVLGRSPERQVAETLQKFGQIRADNFLPNDPEACDSGVLRGQPLWLTSRNSKLREAHRALAAELMRSAAIQAGPSAE